MVGKHPPKPRLTMLAIHQKELEMAEINFGKTVTLKQAATLIATNPEIRFMLRGEPGIGKSTVLKNLEKTHGDRYDYIYADCPVMDVSDVVMRIPDHATKTLQSYVSELFKCDSPKPKMIMLDEVTKANKLLQVIFTRLTLERTVEVCSPSSPRQA